MKKFMFILAFTVIYCKTILAVPAYPYPIVFTQPDGDTLTLVMKGDEHLKFAATIDGYTLMYNTAGYFCYARLNAGGDMEPSEFVARSQSRRTAEEKNFLRTVRQGLFYSNSQLSMLKSIREMRANEDSQQKAFPTTGTRKLLCILIGFTDKGFTLTQEEFNNLFNQVDYNYQNANGSVRDYFLEASYGQLDLQVDVAGPFTASQNMAYYGGNTGGDPQELVREACNMASGDYDFSEYDNDGDGTVDGVYMIFAGYGEEAGGGDNAIWSHKSSLYPRLLLDGVYVSEYSCSPEFRGFSGNNITYIGVICHEFGHVLGAPDYYDTNYGTGGSYEGTGEWDLQAGGSWNDNGRTPPHPNPRSKIYTYNWATVTVLDAPSTVSIQPSTDSSGAFYRINTNTNNEYFLIENKQKKKFDAYVPGHGLVIYRSHANINYGSINATHPQKFYPVAANASVTLPNSSPSSYGNINAASCPWPGTGNKTQFTDNTTPCMKSWANTNTGKPITNISENTATGVITFDFMGGGNRTITATAGEGGVITPSGEVGVDFGGSQTFTFTSNESYHAVQVLVDGDEEATAVFAGNYTFTNVLVNHTIAVAFAPVPDGCNPPTNLTVDYTSNCEAILTWMAPNTGDAPYNIYRDGNLIATGIVELTYTDADFDASADHTWSVAIVCSDNGESQQISVNKDACDYTSRIITATAGEGGTIDPSGAVTVAYGGNQTFTITPYANYRISQVLVDDVEITEAVADNAYTFTNITQHHTISVTFERYYTITATARDNGTITPEGIIILNYGDSQTFTITPDDGSHISRVLVNSVNNADAVASGIYTFPNITRNSTIMAYFAMNTHTITATAGDNGTITPEGAVVVNHGSEQTFTFTPNDGYKIENVLINGANNAEAVANGSYTFGNITADHNIHVTFISLSSIDENILSRISVYSHRNTIYIKNETDRSLRSIEIWDITGRIIQQTSIIDSETEIALQVASGIYNVRLLLQDGKSVMKKIVIKKN
ncbi:MAG: M6 family metalloprotease domain-containing protein [Cytophagaceae bacterium]|jgi:M6 family metalloprotease-like protein|nr:M6 family metalloprotease domain-containing protein [Cytophagaceae bacterium]